MSAEDQERLRQLFEEACDLETRDQREFLAQSCVDEPELQKRLEALLDLDTDEHQVLPESEVMAGFLFHSEAGQVAQRDGGSAGRELSEGLRIGNYTILGTLGRGGMGTVYEARQDSPRRLVALKMLNPGITSRHLIERFKHEGQILGRLDHIGIGRIFESGTLEVHGTELPFYSMERIAGESITAHVSSQAIDRHGVLELVARVCDGLQHAHDKGVVHRDLKPDNILVDITGQPKILDFGVARIVNTETWISTLHTLPGQLIGTLPYMSPEQVSGRPDAVDHRSDIYAVGVLLYRLLAGRLPHDLREMSIPRATRVIQDDDPTRLRQIDKSLQGDLETVVERCLAKEPGRRYARAGDVASDLRRYSEQLPIGAKPITTFDHWVRFARRHRGLVGGVFVAFISLVIGLVFSLWQMDEALVAREESRGEAYRSKISASAAALDLGNVMTARELLDEVDEDQREWEWHYYRSQLDQSLATFDVRSVLDYTFVPEDSSVSAISADGELRRFSIPSGEVVRRDSLDVSGITSAVFSRDGSTLVLKESSPPGLSLWDVQTRTRIASVPVDLDEKHQVAIDPRGIRVAWAEKNSIHVFEPGHPIRVIPAAGSRVSERSLIALDGDLLLAACSYGFVLIVDLASEDGGLQALERQSKALPRCLAIEPGGARVAVGSIDLRVRVWDVAETSLLVELAGHTESPSTITFGTDSQMLITGANDRTLRIWDLASGLSRAVLAGHTQRITSARLHPDGDHMLTRDGDEQLRLWRIDGRDELTVLEGHDSFVYPTVFSPAGDLFASGSWDQTVRLWDSSSSKELKTVSARGRVLELAFSPSGNYLASMNIAREVTVIDTSDESPPISIPDPLGNARHIAWNSDRQLWIAGGGKKIVGSNIALVEVPGGELVRDAVLAGEGVTAFAVSQDKKTLAIGSKDLVIRIIDSETLNILGALGGHTAPILALDFDDTGKRLVSGAEDATARLWDLERFECSQVLSPHRGVIRGVAFSRDGTRVATACDDSLVRIFDPARGERVATIKGHRDYVYSLDFSSTDDLLVTGSGDGTVRLWDPRPLHERFAARYPRQGN